MTQTRKKRFEKLRETSMKRIENAALELFASKGYGHTSISQIAREAGISKGLMYNYYKSKEDLLYAIIRKGFTFGEELVEQGIALCAEHPEDLLQFLIESSFREVIDNPEYWKLLMSLAFQEEVLKKMEAEMAKKREEHLSLGKTIFRELGYPNPKAQAILFAGTLDGVCMHYLLSPDTYPLEDVKNHLIQVFCKRYTEQNS